MKASFCSGSVVHNRLTPKSHRFTYQMSWCLFDLDSIDDLFKQSRFWSLNKFNIVSIRNKDYINNTPASIKSKVRTYLLNHTDKEFNGKIFLFTHPRYMGFGFNSVNFYFCYENDHLLYILSEINNTPWKQKHVYFHDCLNPMNNKGNKIFDYVFNFKKEFHISPFVDMEIDYQWKFTVSPEKFTVQMRLNKQDKRLMNVSLNTVVVPIGKNDLIKWTLKKPFQALKMFTGIYWQAFKLWAKKIPFFTHPKEQTKTKEIQP